MKIILTFLITCFIAVSTLSAHCGNKNCEMKQDYKKTHCDMKKEYKNYHSQMKKDNGKYHCNMNKNGKECKYKATGKASCDYKTKSNVKPKCDCKNTGNCNCKANGKASCDCGAKK